MDRQPESLNPEPNYHAATAHCLWEGATSSAAPRARAIPQYFGALPVHLIEALI